jgi:hypothetical protein
VWTLDLDRLVCPYLPICDPIINGQVAKFDWSHITPAFARTLAPSVLSDLQSNGILPR